MEKRKQKKLAVTLAAITIVVLAAGLLASSQGQVLQTVYTPERTVTKYGYAGITLNTITDPTPNPELVHEIQETFEDAGISLLVFGAEPRKEWNANRFISSSAESIELQFEIAATQTEILDHYRDQLGAETSVETITDYSVDLLVATWSIDGKKLTLGISPSSTAKGKQHVQISMNGPYPLESQDETAPNRL